MLLREPLDGAGKRSPGWNGGDLARSVTWRAFNPARVFRCRGRSRRSQGSLPQHISGWCGVDGMKRHRRRSCQESSPACSGESAMPVWPPRWSTHRTSLGASDLWAAWSAKD